ncbi:MAG: tetratricopeptide repeat protein, partial [Proteobacteria bacterium]|nr:tetratricopeptide repeat protein [Pseudomonadota bacterium]
MAILLVAAVVWITRTSSSAVDDAQTTTREVASKLRAAGLFDEAAHLYEQYLQESDEDPEAHARIAYSLGETYLEAGRYEQALRWFYEAETVGPAPEDTGARIVHCLERLGRIHQAQATLSSRTALGPPESRHSASDPVVARLGAREVFRSEVVRAMDDLPREVARAFEGPDGKQQFLQRFVADELIWRKAQKLEYGKDPDVRRRLDLAHRRIATDTFIEREIVGKISVNDGDLQTFFMAHQQHYRQPEAARVSLLKVATTQEAQGILAQLGEGTSFEALAKKHSPAEAKEKW